MSSGNGAVGPTEAAVPRDLFLPHSATSCLSLVFCRSFLKYLGTWLRYRVRLGFYSRQGLRFLSSHPSRLSLDLADLPVRWEYRTLRGVKRPERWAYNSPASNESREEECMDLRFKFTHMSPLRGLSKKLCIFAFTSCALDVFWCCHNCICDLHRRVVRNILVLSCLSSVLNIGGRVTVIEKRRYIVI